MHSRTAAPSQTDDGSWSKTCALNHVRLRRSAGADPGFSNRGGAKDYAQAAHISRTKREVPHGQGPGPSRILDALPCYLSLFETFRYKTGYKKT